MNELKLVKHALKKMLRLSRQLILENEYLQFLNLMPIAKVNATNVEKSSSSEGELQFSEEPGGGVGTGRISNPPEFQRG